MRVLHLLSDGPETSGAELRKLQGAECDVEVIDLSTESVDYAVLVDRIFASDKVVSW